MHTGDMQSESNAGGGKKYAFRVSGSFLITLMKQETASRLDLESNGNISNLSVKETHPHQPGTFICQDVF